MEVGNMNEVLRKEIDEYIEKNFWYSEWRIEQDRHRRKFSVRIADESDEDKVKVKESWTQRLKKRFDYILANMKEDIFAQRLWKLIKEKEISNVEVYKRANLDRRLFSKIRKEKSYKPSKNTAIALAIALELDEEEFDDLLKRAGFALSGANKGDVIIRYFVGHKQYDIYTINEVLEHYGLPILGERKS